MTAGAGQTFEAYLKDTYRPGSVRSYANRVERYRRHIGDGIDAATYRDVLAYVAQLRRGGGVKAKSLLHELAAVKIYYTWLQETGQRADHPCRTMKLADAVDRQVRLDQLYEREQLESLATGYRAADPEDQRRGEVIIGLLIHQALTAGEITRLRLDDVDLEAGLIRVAAGGKTAARTLALRASQVLALWRYVDQSRARYVAMATAAGKAGDWLLFDTQGGQLDGGQLNRLINQGREKADRLRPQKIRQTVIAELIAAGHDVRIVQAFAGHRRSAATEEYKRTGLEELAEAVAKHHPRG